MSSADEVEIVQIFNIDKDAIPIWCILSEINHTSKGPTSIQTCSNNIEGVDISTIRNIVFIRQLLKPSTTYIRVLSTELYVQAT